MYRDLFKQAEALATLDAKKPKQVNSRRAVSSAYYAVFHYLVEEACRVQLGTQHAQTPYRDVLARAFVHGTMKSACTGFNGGSPKAAVFKGLPRDASGKFPTHIAIKEVARVFADLLQKRHFADYDRSERLKRSEVLSVIEEAKDRVANFDALPMADDKRFFLICLWAWKELVNR